MRWACLLLLCDTLLQTNVALSEFCTEESSQIRNSEDLQSRAMCFHEGQQVDQKIVNAQIEIYALLGKKADNQFFKMKLTERKRLWRTSSVM